MYWMLSSCQINIQKNFIGLSLIAAGEFKFPLYRFKQVRIIRFSNTKNFILISIFMIKPAQFLINRRLILVWANVLMFDSLIAPPNQIYQNCLFNFQYTLIFPSITTFQFSGALHPPQTLPATLFKLLYVYLYHYFPHSLISCGSILNI